MCTTTARARSAAPTPSHPHASGDAKSRLYNPRHPERTLFYRTVSEHFETWLELSSTGQFDGQGDHHTPSATVRRDFRKYLECGIFVHGFARARCNDCGHDWYSRHWNSSTASPPWYRLRAFIGTATLECWRRTRH